MKAESQIRKPDPQLLTLRFQTAGFTLAGNLCGMILVRVPMKAESQIRKPDPQLLFFAQSADAHGWTSNSMRRERKVT